MTFLRSALLGVGMLGIVVGCALMTVAEDDLRLQSAGRGISLAGLVYLGLAIMVEGWD